MNCRHFAGWATGNAADPEGRHIDCVAGLRCLSECRLADRIDAGGRIRRRLPTPTFPATSWGDPDGSLRRPASRQRRADPQVQTPAGMVSSWLISRG